MSARYVYIVYGLIDTGAYPIDFSIYDDFKTAYKNFYNRASARGNEFDYELWRVSKNAWNGKQKELYEWTIGSDYPWKVGDEK